MDDNDDAFERQRFIRACKEARSCELHAYSEMVSALRATGDYDEKKQEVLTAVRNYFDIPIEFHKTEIKRALCDSHLEAVSSILNEGEQMTSGWDTECESLVKNVFSQQAQNKFTVLADHIADKSCEQQVQQALDWCRTKDFLQKPEIVSQVKNEKDGFIFSNISTVCYEPPLDTNDEDDKWLEVNTRKKKGLHMTKSILRKLQHQERHSKHLKGGIVRRLSSKSQLMDEVQLKPLKKAYKASSNRGRKRKIPVHEPVDIQENFKHSPVATTSDAISTAGVLNSQQYQDIPTPCGQEKRPQSNLSSSDVSDTGTSFANAGSMLGLSPGQQSSSAAAMAKSRSRKTKTVTQADAQVNVQNKKFVENTIKNIASHCSPLSEPGGIVSASSNVGATIIGVPGRTAGHMLTSTPHLLTAGPRLSSGFRPTIGSSRDFAAFAPGGAARMKHPTAFHNAMEFGAGTSAVPSLISAGTGKPSFEPTADQQSNTFLAQSLPAHKVNPATTRLTISSEATTSKVVSRSAATVSASYGAPTAVITTATQQNKQPQQMSVHQPRPGGVTVTQSKPQLAGAPPQRQFIATTTPYILPAKTVPLLTSAGQPATATFRHQTAAFLPRQATATGNAANIRISTFNQTGGLRPALTPVRPTTMTTTPPVDTSDDPDVIPDSAMQ